MRDLASESPDTDPRWWLALIEHLPDDGAFAASVAFAAPLPDPTVKAKPKPSARDYRGWGHDRYLLAGLYDALNTNTVVTGNWGKGKAPKMQPWPRPKAGPAVARIADTPAENWPPTREAGT